jgi:23S rRNA (uridine2552-2'-O)-methyltransferase
VSRRFVDQRRRDRFYRAAQQEGLRSRAAFKLGHLANRFPIFHRGDSVLDLGAAPGGWSLVARGALGRTGRVVAVDPRDIEPADGVQVVRGRVGDPRLLPRLAPLPYDVVLSDMSPRVSGAYATDHARSVGLVRDALALAEVTLRPGGVFVAKVFAGDMLEELMVELKPRFERVVLTKPPASREASSEMYIIGLEFRPASPEPAVG